MDTKEQPEEIQREIEVLREDDGPLAQLFISALREVNLQPREVLTLTEGTFGLVIPADFSARLRDGQPVTVTLHEPPTDNATPMVEEAINAARGRIGGAVLVAQLGVQQAQAAQLLTTPAETATFFEGLLTDTLAAADHPPAVVQVHWATDKKTSAAIGGMAQASAGQMVTWVQITLLGVAEVLVDERKNGTLRRMIITPTRWATIWGGKLLAHLLLGLTQIAVLIGGEMLFHIGWRNATGATVVVSIAFALATVSLGMWLATLVKTRRQANSLVMLLSMAMAALGGAWWPLEVTPTVYRQIVHVLPTTWAMQAYTSILARGASISDVSLEVAVLLGYALLFAALALRSSEKLRA